MQLRVVQNSAKVRSNITKFPKQEYRTQPNAKPDLGRPKTPHRGGLTLLGVPIYVE